MAKLESVLEELGRVVVVAHSIGGKEGERQIDELFVADDNGVLEPLSKRIRLIEDQEVDVPNYTIRHLSGIVLDELEIELETNIDIQELNGRVSMHTSLKKRNPFSRSSHIKIRAKYRLTQISEGIELLRDKFNTKLSDALDRINI